MGWSPTAGGPRRQPELYSPTVRERAGLQLSRVVNRESYRGIKILMEENVVKKEEPRMGADKQATIAQSAQTPSEAF